MAKPNTEIEVAKITSRQAVLIAVITMLGGLMTGYFGKQGSQAQNLSQMSTEIAVLEVQVASLVEARDAAVKEATEAHYALDTMKQRVRDILGPKEDVLKRMVRSLERLKGDPEVSEEHQERLADVAAELDKIDTRVLQLVEN